MPRQTRLILPGVAVHVIQRGNDRMSCFREESDYFTYLACLRGLLQRHACTLHAFCLMTNHVHLLLTPSFEQACAALMRDLGQRYVQYFNRRYDRTGTLWEGRFRSCIAESSRYVLACYRYIELNPVRAGVVAQPIDYPWSSFSVNSGLGTSSMILAHSEYIALASTDEGRRAAYKELFEQELDSGVVKAIRDSTNGGYPLTSEGFAVNMRRHSTRKLKPERPGPKTKRRDLNNSGSDPELFSGGGVS